MPLRRSDRRPIVGLSAQQKYDLLLKGGHVIDRAEPDQRGSRRRDRERQGRGRRRQHRSDRRAQSRRCLRTTTSRRGSWTFTSTSSPAPANADPTPATTASIPTASRCDQASPPSSMPDPRAGGASRTSRIASSIAPGRACWRCSTSSATACAATSSSRTWPTWKPSRPRTWRCATRAWSSASRRAHYAGPEWAPVERAVEAGTQANIPVMVDFGANRPERPMAELVTKKLRPGDIYTHAYSGLRDELDRLRPREPGHVGRPQARRDLRRRPRRRQLCVADCGARDERGLPSRFDFHRSPHRQHELRA